MKLMNWVLAGVVIGAVGVVGAASADPMPMDSPVTANGIETVCTGIGSGEDDPRWKSYPIRIEFSDHASQYLAGAHLTLSDNGKTLTAFDCAGAWILFRLPPGSYKATASLLYNQGGGERSVMFSPPATGQKRLVIQFPK